MPMRPSPCLAALLLLGGVSFTAVIAGAQSATQPAQRLAVEHLEANAAAEPLGLDDQTPRLSWALLSPERGVAQSAYRVLVASRPELLREGRADVWDSGAVRSAEPWAEYAGPALQPRTRYHWAVRVTGDGGVRPPGRSPPGSRPPCCGRPTGGATGSPAPSGRWSR